MSKSENEQRYLYVLGKKVAVSEEVYEAYWEYQRKEDYFTTDLKQSHVCSSTGEVIPSREVSLEQYMQSNSIYISTGSFEEELISKISLEEFCSGLKEEECFIVKCLIEEQMTQGEIADELGIPASTFSYKKHKIGNKLIKN